MVRACVKRFYSNMRFFLFIILWTIRRSVGTYLNVICIIYILVYVQETRSPINMHKSTVLCFHIPLYYECMHCIYIYKLVDSGNFSTLSPASTSALVAHRPELCTLYLPALYMYYNQAHNNIISVSYIK